MTSIREMEVSELAEEFGYQLLNTGGGCTGFEHSLEDGKSILITIDEDALAPNDPMEECVAYLYDELGDYEPISQPIAFRKLLVLLQVKFQI